MIGPNRILIVDDQDTQIQVLRDQLRDFDFEVDGITDPLKVLDHLRKENEYAVLIIDVNLGPRKDGITLASQIRTHLAKKTPILFVSADASKEARSRIRRFSLDGGVSFLEKGTFDSERLFEEIIALIRETDRDLKLDEVRGRQAGLKDEFHEVKQIIVDFVTDQAAVAKVTQKECDEKMSRMVGSAVGIAIGKATSQANTKIEEALQPEALEAKLEEALKPELAFRKVRASQAWKIAVYFLLVIFAGLCIFWGTTWNKADHADDGVRALEIKHTQVINTMQAQTQQIQRLLSVSPRVLTTVP